MNKQAEKYVGRVVADYLCGNRERVVATYLNIFPLNSLGKDMSELEWVENCAAQDADGDPSSVCFPGLLEQKTGLPSSLDFR